MPQRKSQNKEKKQNIVDQLYNPFSNFKNKIMEFITLWENSLKISNQTKQLKHKKSIKPKPISGFNHYNKTSTLTNSISSRIYTHTQKYFQIYPDYLFCSIIRPIQVHHQNKQKPFL